MPGAEGAAVLCHGAKAESWRLVPRAMVGDFEARLRARTEPGGEETYGLAFRWQNPQSYSLVRVDTRNNNVRLYYRAPAGWTLLAARDLGVAVGQWHEIAVWARGSRLAVALDREPLFMAHDDRLAAGEVALWAGADTAVCFDGLWLTARSGGA